MCPVSSVTSPSRWVPGTSFHAALPTAPRPVWSPVRRHLALAPLPLLQWCVLARLLLPPLPELALWPVRRRPALLGWPAPQSAGSPSLPPPPPPDAGRPPRASSLWPRKKPPTPLAASGRSPGSREAAPAVLAAESGRCALVP